MKDAEKHKKAHELLSNQRMSQVIKLASGEQISYAEVGDRSGTPVIWFGGPCSNRFIIALYADVCTEMGLRLLCFDRPGRGASTPLRNPKHWSFASWTGILS
jgi:pimeloyl-ACP methyl ester carboxylesterase